MILNGHDFETDLELRDIYAARRKGLDIGDLQNGKLQSIAVDLLAAIDAAYLLYQKRLKKNGITSHDELIDCDPSELHELAEGLRDALEVFFPMLPPMREEIRKAIEEIGSQSTTSGPSSGELPESLNTNRGAILSAN